MKSNKKNTPSLQRNSNQAAKHVDLHVGDGDACVCVWGGGEVNGEKITLISRFTEEIICQ